MLMRFHFSWLFNLFWIFSSGLLALLDLAGNLDLLTSGTVVVGQGCGSLRGVPQWPKRHSFCDGQPEDGRAPSGGVVDA